MPHQGSDRDGDGRFVHGHGLAAAGGDAKEQRRADALEALWADVPPLTDEASAQVRLWLLSEAAARGLLSGSQANAAVRACEVFLKARDAEVDRKHLRELEAKLAELEQELATARRGR